MERMEEMNERRHLLQKSNKIGFFNPLHYDVEIGFFSIDMIFHMFFPYECISVFIGLQISFF